MYKVKKQPNIKERRKAHKHFLSRHFTKYSLCIYYLSQKENEDINPLRISVALI